MIAIDRKECDRHAWGSHLPGGSHGTMPHCHALRRAAIQTSWKIAIDVSPYDGIA